MNFLAKAYYFLTSPVRAWPDFLIIGAQRSGTTALFNYLGQHPDISLPIKKESHYFDRFFSRGSLWYRAHFPVAKSKKISGEATPYYLFYPLAPARVKSALPQIKLIIILRSPDERAVSHYWHEARRGFEKLSLDAALKAERQRLAGEREKILKNKNYYSFAYEHYSYLARGVYVEQIKNWRRFFPAEQMLVLNYNDLLTEPAAVLGQIFSFLNLKPWPIKPLKPPARPYPPPVPAVKKYLKNYFQPFNRSLYAYLGRDFGW